MVFCIGSSQKILSICECYPAGVQLVEMGYFPCAPVRPTLAFDINLLEFVTIGSHHMAPNVTGWSSVLQYFLSIRGYLVGEKVRPALPSSRMALKSHLGRDPAAFRKCFALVSSSRRDDRPGSRYMGPEYDLRCDDLPRQYQRRRPLQWHRNQRLYTRDPWEDIYALLSVRYAERVTTSIPIAKRLPADGRERTKRRCTVDISSAAVPNMLFWNAKSSDFRVRPKCGGLY